MADKNSKTIDDQSENGRKKAVDQKRHAREECKSFMLQFEDDIQNMEDQREIMQAAAENVGKYLKTDRAGYAEIDKSGEYLLVKNDWTSDRVPSLKGKLKVDDFGPKFIEELTAGNTVSFDDH